MLSQNHVAQIEVETVKSIKIRKNKKGAKGDALIFPQKSGHTDKLHYMWRCVHGEANTANV